MKQQQGALPLVLLCMHSTVAAAIGVERLSNETILSPPQDTDETLQQMWRRMEAEFVAKDNHDYTTIAMLFLVVIALLGAFETLDLLTYCIGNWTRAKEIPVRGKHLDELSWVDYAFIAFNKLSTVLYIFFVVRYCFTSDNVVWTEPSLWNAVLPVAGFFVIYDFFYVMLHGALHMKAIYGLVHKHHHHQKAPSRANTDAINVHPIEFVLGEYNHLLAIYLYSSCVTPIHPLSCILFMVVAGLMAGFNHTRFDMVWEMFGIQIFDSKAHDVHHRIPQSNYGQYTMLWDYIFGSYRPYNEDDRVNPKYQLDSKSGKSIMFMEEQAKKLKEKSQ